MFFMKFINWERKGNFNFRVNWKHHCILTSTTEKNCAASFLTSSCSLYLATGEDQFLES